MTDSNQLYADRYAGRAPHTDPVKFENYSDSATAFFLQQMAQRPLRRIFKTAQYAYIMPRSVPTALRIEISK